jgi:hypothetical protein
LFSITTACAIPGAQPDADKGLAERLKQENLDEMSIYDAAVAKLRAGMKLTEEETDECDRKFRAHFDELAEKHGVRDNTLFPQDVQVDFYATAVKMAMIDFPDHGGWPFRSTLRFTVAKPLKELTAETDDSFLLFCAVFPSLSRGDVDHAALCYKKLKESDEFLAKTTRSWLEKYFKNDKVKAKFKEAAGIN